MEIYVPFFNYRLLICCFLTFCSLSSNQISDEGACELVGALQVNQSLQELRQVSEGKITVHA